MPKVIRIFTPLSMEQAFFKRLEFNNEKEVWNMAGDSYIPVNLTAREDFGGFTVEAAIMAYHEPEKVCERVIIHTVTHTFREYVAIFDKYANTGNKLKFIAKPLKQAKEDWKIQKHSIAVGMVFPLLLLRTSRSGNCS